MTGIYHPTTFIALLFSATAFAAPNIRTETLGNLLMEITASAPARVVSVDHSMLSAQVAGMLLELSPRVGDRVSRNQRLARIDCRDYTLALSRAQATLNAVSARLKLAQGQLKRVHQLHLRGNASTELRDQRQSKLNNLLAERAGQQVAIEQARLQVARCEIVAPFDALVTERPGAVGSLAAPGSPIIRLLRDQAPEVQAQLSPAQLRDLQSSARVYLLADKERFPLRLRAALPLINTQAHTQEVRFEFSDRQTLSGTTGRLIWASGQRRLPAQYLLRRQGTLGVMLYQNNKALFFPLPQAVEGQAALINLPLITPVVIEGQHGLVSGTTAIIKVRYDAGTLAE